MSSRYWHCRYVFRSILVVFPFIETGQYFFLNDISAPLPNPLKGYSFVPTLLQYNRVQSLARLVCKTRGFLDFVSIEFLENTLLHTSIQHEYHITVITVFLFLCFVAMWTSTNEGTGEWIERVNTLVCRCEEQEQGWLWKPLNSAGRCTGVRDYNSTRACDL